MEKLVSIPRPKEESEQVRALHGSSTEMGAVDSPVPPHALDMLPPILVNRSAQRVLAPLVVQPKMTIGAPDAIYEKEADAVAEREMSAHDPQATGTAASDDDHNFHFRLTRKPADHRLARQAMLRRIPIRSLGKSWGIRALARLLQEDSPMPSAPELRRRCVGCEEAEDECPRAV